MPATDVLEQEILDLLFLNLAFDNIGDATGIPAAGTAGNFECSAHTGAALTDSAIQTTQEATYTSYARVDDASTARAGSAWTVLTGTVDNDLAITFPAATGGSETLTSFGLGSDISATELWIYGTLGSSLAVSDGITPEFSAGDLDISVT